MNKERELLPWILGGLSAAAIAVAFASVSTQRAAPTSPPLADAQPVASPTLLPPTLHPALPPAATTQAAPPAADLEPVAAPVSPAPQAQSAVWECTTNGVKTFSNNPCGEKSTLLEIGPINTMSAAPVIHYARAYGAEPRYVSGYADRSAPDDEYPDQYAADTGGNSYTVVQEVGFIARRRRPEHFHRPPNSHNPAHNPGPVRRN